MQFGGVDRGAVLRICRLGARAHTIWVLVEVLFCEIDGRVLGGM